MPPNHHWSDRPDIEQKNERERLLAQVALRIRQSLELETILNTTVAEVRQLLGCDRVLVYRFSSNWDGTIVAESVAPEQTPSLGSQIADSFFQLTRGITYRQGTTQAIANIDRAGLPESNLQFLKQFDVKANLAIPILMNRDSGVTSQPPEQLNPSPHLWGLLVAHQCTDARQWQSVEIDFLERLAVQIAIALQQAELYQQLKAELAQRQRTEVALRSSEQQYRRLFDCNPNPMWVYDLETLSFLAVNQAAISHYGYSRQEFLAMTIADLRSPEDIAEAIATVSRVSNKLYSNSGVAKQYKKDGTEIDVELTSNAIAWSGRPARIVMANDITQRLHSEKALRESQRRYATLADASPVGLFRTNAQGYCTYANQRAYEIIGLNAEESMGHGWAKSLHPEDRDRVLTEWYRTVRENMPFHCEYRFVRPDGEITWVFGQGVAETADNGEIIGYVGTITDITDRIRAEQALQNLNEKLEHRVLERTAELANSVDRLQREIADRERAQREQHLLTERLQYLLASSPTLIYCCNADCQPTFVSENAKSILGYEPREYLEDLNFWLNRVHPGDVTRLLAEKPALFETNRHVCEYRFLHADGTYHWLRDDARVVRDAAGNVLEIVGSSLDITERKQAEIALRDSEEQFRQLAETIREVFFLESADGREVLYISPGYESIWGRSCQSLYEQPISWQESIHPQDRDRIIGAFQHLAEWNGEINEEYRIIRPDGTLRWIGIRTAFVRDRAGIPYRLAGIAEDITARKQAEAALRHSEARFHKMAANVPGMLYQYQLQTDGIEGFIYVSSACREIFEIDLDTVQRDSDCLWSTIHPESLLSLKNAVAASSKSLEPLRWEGQIVTPSGRQKWIQSFSRPERQPNGNIIWDGVLIDISDRKQAQAKLEQRNRYSSALVAAQRQLLVAPSDKSLYDKILSILGPATDASRVYIFENHFDAEGRLLTSQKAEWCAPGIDPDIDSPASQNLCYDEFFPGWSETLSNGGIIQGIVAEFSDSMREILDPQGIQSILILPLIVNGEFFGVIGFDNCIEARAWEPLEVDLLNSTASAIALAKERQLMQESLERLVAAVEATTDGIAIFNERNEFIYVNSAFLRLFDYQVPHQLLGKTWHHLYSPDESERLDRDILAQLVHLGHWRGEATGKKSDGTTLEQEVSLTCIANVGIICVCRDISRRKQAEAQIKASLKEKEVLLKEIHHRVKNNLQIVQSLLRLQSNHTQDPHAIQMFRDSQNRIRSMALVHELLYRSTNLASIDFSEYIHNLTATLSRAYDATRQSVKIKVNAQPIQLDIDMALPCGLIISELITNALKYAFTDGRAGTIDVEFYVSSADRFTLMVRDNGVGFPEHIDFRNTDSLGLQLVCDSTEQLEGNIELDRTNGTTFAIEFTEIKYKNRT